MLIENENNFIYLFIYSFKLILMSYLFCIKLFRYDIFVSRSLSATLSIQ